MGFPCSSVGKGSACSAGDLGSIPGLERSPGEGNINPLQYSCLENPTDGGAWRATVRGVAESQSRRSDFTFTAFTSTAFVLARQSDITLSELNIFAGLADVKYYLIMSIFCLFIGCGYLCFFVECFVQVFCFSIGFYLFFLLTYSDSLYYSGYNFF